MNKDLLLRRKAEIEQRYDELARNKADTEDEMKRLQGEHRLVSDLLKDAPSEPEKPKRLKEDEVEDAEN